MRYSTVILLYLMLFCIDIPFTKAQKPSSPGHQLTGLGGQEYVSQSVIFSEFAEKPDGYYLFEPASPRPDSAHVIVFLHGYGAYNPMIFGKWIAHLVKKGNIVIYPRYQKSLFSPKPEQFAANCAKGIQDAIALLQDGNHVKPILNHVIYIGHSYGGTVCADFAVNHAKYQVPKPTAMLLCQPGTAKFKGGRLKNYSKADKDLLLTIIVTENDGTTGDEFGKLVYQTATNTPKRTFLRVFRDNHGFPALTATHLEPYSLLMDFDTKVNNFTSKRAIHQSKFDAYDYNLHWRIADAMMDCTRQAKNCNYCTGNTPEISDLGNWSDGVPVKKPQVIVPNTQSSTVLK
jgi:pimeloyl-ACP methyl ester carboxylesterase